MFQIDLFYIDMGFVFYFMTIVYAQKSVEQTSKSNIKLLELHLFGIPTRF